jgi:predicted GH43/DUF377 family glycosyl hydrolase
MKFPVLPYLLTAAMAAIGAAHQNAQARPGTPADAPFTAAPVETTAGWVKYAGNPVLGGQYGTCFDISALKEGAAYRMWLSWRPKASVALSESSDGFHWSEPVAVLGPNPATDWEQDLNRPVVLKRNATYHMWYSAFNRAGSALGYAASPDGRNWTRRSAQPVLSPDQPWEKQCLMCPHVLWDDEAQVYKMWYSAGERNEPNAIGYATSPDGLHWTKNPNNPIFVPDPTCDWEKHKVTACQVVHLDGWYVMFYIGFRDEPTAQIGLARSRDGITHWQRHWANPIIRRAAGQWDADACYKPYAIFDSGKWTLWYNGRRGSLEQIGAVVHEGRDLGFHRLPPDAHPAVLKTDSFQHYFEAFNATDQELYPQYVRNCSAWDFLKDNIPLLDCPDKEIEETYYFRWWTYRKHLKCTADGYVVTEFLPPVGWAGKDNSINCAAGHHFYEGRWLGDPTYLDAYAEFWFRHGGDPRRYSCWLADALWARRLVTGDDRLTGDLLPDLVRNYEAWIKEHRDTNGLFWQTDNADGMEVSISGRLGRGQRGYRPTLNSYLYGDALAIANIAERAGQRATARLFRARAAELKRLVQEKLWDSSAQFFKVLPVGETTGLAKVREEHGFTPWYFNLPDTACAPAWKQLLDPQGFYAPFGPATAERRDPAFAVSYEGHECQWNGPSWPYSTAVTLTALANLLDNYRQHAISRQDYFDLLKIYTRSHRRKLDDGRVVPWIDENLNPLTGDWLARTRLRTLRETKTRNEAPGIEERGKDYNHSTYCDLIITGLLGLRPRADNTVEVNPLAPATWDYFCLDNIHYHGHVLAILFDRTGERYHQGKGLRLWADGREIAASARARRLSAELPSSP